MFANEQIAQIKEIMSSTPHRLDPFFNPQRIAIIGASERGMYPSGVLRNLLDYGYKGEVYPVSLSRETVFGLKAYPDITKTPQTPDLAIIIVPRKAVLATLKQCVQKGVPAAVVITAGFAESDDEGKVLQTKLADFIKTNPITVIGPNCAGLADMHTKAISTRLPVPPKAGTVSFVSQSGALMMALYGLFADRQIGMNRILSLGNQLDVNLSESIAYLVADEKTQVIGTFIEGLQDAPAFANTLQEALIIGKSIILLKSGRTESGQAAAATHTAALAGSAKVFDAVCEQFGAIQVNDISEMMDTLQLAATFGDKLQGAGKIALVTQSGGLGSLSADLVEGFGLIAPPLSKALSQKLLDLPHIPDFGLLANPSDVRGSSVIGEATAETLAPFLNDSDTDAVVLLLAKSAVREQDVETAKSIVDATKSSEKPLIVIWVGQRHPVDDPDWALGHEILREAGIPLFAQASDGLRALSHLFHHWQFREKWLENPTNLQIPERKSKKERENKALSYAENMALLEKYQIPLAPAKLVKNEVDTLVAAQEMGFPVALKAISTELTHKSDAGLVELNLQNADELARAAKRVFERLGGHRIEGLQVQKMLPSGVEVILGISTDPQFGLVLAFGTGGILVELLDDVVLRLPPISETQVREMIKKTKAWRLLQGFRGSPPADIDALVTLIVNLSKMAVEETSTLDGLDLNPVIVLPKGQGAYAVDYRAFR